MVVFNYDEPATALTQILEWVEERIDLAHGAAVEERHVKALQWEPVDHVPVSFFAPLAEPFVSYPYFEVFNDPTKMLVNELVGPEAMLGASPSMINSVLIKDDLPLQIRANYGVGLIASLFGAESEVTGDNFPWVRPIGLAAVKRLVAGGVPDLQGGLFQRALDTMAYYREALAPYPKCRQAIHITQPDLQGPFDIAAQLWGGEIFTAFYDDPGFLRELLDLLAETYVLVCRKLAAASTEFAREGFIYLHLTICKGRCLLKDDSSVMLSPRLYTEFIRPANEKVLQAMGGGGIHFCGSGDQWRSEFVDTDGLVAVDFGQLYLNDVLAWAATLRERRLPVVNTHWTRDAFVQSDPVRLFPTGASLAVVVDSLDEVREIMEGVGHPNH